MSRIFEQAQAAGGTRVLILGAGAYPHARKANLRVPELQPISSAAKSAMDLAARIVGDWRDCFMKPLASVDLLVAGVGISADPPLIEIDGLTHRLDPPTMENVKQARDRWLMGAIAEDVLIFYCCGHGLLLPSAGQTFLTTSFGKDEYSPWGDTIALDDFAVGLKECAPRQQWLFFDCCSNIPPIALRTPNARGEPLVVSVAGTRNEMVRRNGDLSQVVISSASPEASALGKDNRASRFMEALLEACEGVGCQRNTNGRWWVDDAGLLAAIISYRYRVAPIEEEEYFKIPAIALLDFTETPRLLSVAAGPKCCLLVRTAPPHRLKDADLEVACNGAQVGGHRKGPSVQIPYRQPVQSYLAYDVKATFDGEPPTSRQMIAIPPLVEAEF